jgi:cytochrome b involved in lipid metabolism
MNKKIIGVIVVLSLLLVGYAVGSYYFKNQERSNFGNNNLEIKKENNNSKNFNEEVLEEEKAKQNETNNNETNNLTQEAINYYTIQDVSQHNSKDSCWTVVRGEVFDLTQWISRHPGGPEKILNICGKDGTKAFVNKHGSQEKPESILEGFKIGKLKE